MQKNLLARKTTFLKTKSAMKARVPLTNESSGKKTHRAGKAEKVFSTIFKKLHQFHRIEKQQRGHPQDSGNFKKLTVAIYARKTLVSAENLGRQFRFEKNLKKSHGAEKLLKGDPSVSSYFRKH